MCHECPKGAVSVKKHTSRQHVIGTVQPVAQRNDLARMDSDTAAVTAACDLPLHADYITDYLLGSHMLYVKELWTGSPYITTHYAAHLINLTHGGEQNFFTSNPNTPNPSSSNNTCPRVSGGTRRPPTCLLLSLALPSSSDHSPYPTTLLYCYHVNTCT